MTKIIEIPETEEDLMETLLALERGEELKFKVKPDLRLGDRHLNTEHRRELERRRQVARRQKYGSATLRGSKGQNRYKEPSKFKRADFVAWDGEGITLRGIHTYTLLANSRGGILRNPKGIGTAEALDFFCDEGSKYKNCIHVIFVGSYDCNMIFKDIPKEKLGELWRTGQVTWENFVIRYTHRKRLNVFRHPKDGNWFKQKGLTKQGKPNYVPNYDASIMVWDVFGFFQSSFVDALGQWLPGEVPELETIVRMKAGRSSFTGKDRIKVEKYNALELQYLVQLMERVAKCHAEVGIILHSWDGAGATAASLLRQHNVKDFQAEPPKEVQIASQYAYSGGRIESILHGNVTSRRIYRYDINSAYPSQMGKLPCLQHGRWIHRDTGAPFSLHKIAWRFLPDKPFYPFFFRRPDYSIIYPSEGRGWYWKPETEGIECFIEESWSYETTCNCDPLSWVAELYEYRLKLKKEGNAAEKVIKLGMNSLYGKFAQQVGYSTRGRIPPYHNLCWAGYITSSTRAQIYRAAIQKPQDTIAFCTDAVLSLSPLDLNCSNKLGEWDFKQYDGITAAQAGVYWVRDKNHASDKAEWGEKYRGFDRGSVKRDSILQSWRNRGNFKASLTRFIGMGSALHSEKFWAQWRSWQTTERNLLIYPTGKRTADGDHDYSKGLYPTKPAVNVYEGMMSKRYPIVWLGEDNPYQDEEIDGVPSRLIDQEIDDSYA